MNTKKLFLRIFFVLSLTTFQTSLAANSGFDVPLNPKIVTYLSVDDKPIANAVQVLWVEANKYGFGICGERPPYPGICWHPTHLTQVETRSNKSGQIAIQGNRFKDETGKLSDLEIKIMTYGIAIPECEAGPHESYYSIAMESDCDTLRIYGYGASPDLLKVDQITCHFKKNSSQIEAEIKNALATCKHN